MPKKCLVQILELEQVTLQDRLMCEMVPCKTICSHQTNKKPALQYWLLNINFFVYIFGKLSTLYLF